MYGPLQSHLQDVQLRYLVKLDLEELCTFLCFYRAANRHFIGEMKTPRIFFSEDSILSSQAIDIGVGEDTIVDPEFLSRIQIFPSRIPDPGSKRFWIPDPDPLQLYLTQKIVSMLSEI